MEEECARFIKVLNDGEIMGKIISMQDILDQRQSNNIARIEEYRASYDEVIKALEEAKQMFEWMCMAFYDAAEVIGLDPEEFNLDTELADDVYSQTIESSTSPEIENHTYEEPKYYLVWVAYIDGYEYIIRVFNNMEFTDINRSMKIMATRAAENGSVEYFDVGENRWKETAE